MSIVNTRITEDTNLDQTSIVALFNSATKGLTIGNIGGTSPFPVTYGTCIILKRAEDSGFVFAFSHYREVGTIYQYSISNNQIVAQHKHTGASLTI